MFLGWLVQPNVITGYTVCYPQKMVGHGKFSLSSVAVFTANWKLLATVLGYEKNEGKGNRFGKRALLNCVQYKTRHISSTGPLKTKVNHQCNWQICLWDAEFYERFQALTGHKCKASRSNSRVHVWFESEFSETCCVCSPEVTSNNQRKVHLITGFCVIKNYNSDTYSNPPSLSSHNALHHKGRQECTEGPIFITLSDDDYV